MAAKEYQLHFLTSQLLQGKKTRGVSHSRGGCLGKERYFKPLSVFEYCIAQPGFYTVLP